MKKFKVLSSILALVMVLSTITVLPVGAAEATGTIFADFESLTPGNQAFSVLNGIGVKSYRVDYNYGAADNQFKVVEETGTDNQGIAAASGSVYAYVPVAETARASTGKVYAGFSMKGQSFRMLCANFGSGVTTTYYGHYLAQITGDISPAVGVNTGDRLATGARDKAKWSKVFVVLDLDNDTWTVYLDGTKVGDTYSLVERYSAKGYTSDTVFYGIGFEDYNTTNDDGMIDDIGLVTYSDDVPTATLNAENTVISVVIPQQLVVNPEDITVTKCGSTDTVGVSSVAYGANKLDITLSEALDAGCEYRVTFDNYDGVEFYASAAPEIRVSNEYENDFEDCKNRTDEGYTNYVNDTDGSVKKIIESSSTLADGSNKVGVIELTDSATVLNGTEAKGNVIVGRSFGTFSLLDRLTDVSSGIEVYEFDYKLYCGDSGGTNAVYNIQLKADINGEMKVLHEHKAYQHTNKWRHVKIEYDHDAKTFTYTALDGTPTVIEDVNSFNGGLTIGSFGYSSEILYVDNYKHYSLSSLPTVVEKVRYTSGGKVTGSDLISPATNKIDITFNKEVDANIANAVTLTANGETVTINSRNITGTTLTLGVDSLPANAKIALTVPAVNRTWNVRTEKVDVTIGGLTLTGAQPEGSISAGAEITVTASDVIATGSVNITLIYAFYSGDELVAVESARKLINAGDNDSISHTFTVKEDIIGYDEVKAFAWDELTTMVPLITSHTVTAQ